MLKTPLEAGATRCVHRTSESLQSHRLFGRLQRLISDRPTYQTQHHRGGMQQPFYFYGPPLFYGHPTFEQQHGRQQQPLYTPPFYGSPAYSPLTFVPPSFSPPTFPSAGLPSAGLLLAGLLSALGPTARLPIRSSRASGPAYEIQKFPEHSLLRTPSAQKAYNNVARIWENAAREVNATAQPSQHHRMRHANDLQPLPAEPTDAGPPQLHLQPDANLEAEG
jgi:hypothetical protein